MDLLSERHSRRPQDLRTAGPELLVLDTSVVSLLFREGAAESRLARRIRGRRVCISFQTLEEVLFGARKARWGRRRVNALHRHLRQYRVIWCGAELVGVSARLRAREERAGRRLATADAWIAATALLLDCPLVTADSDFRRVDGLSDPECLIPRLLRFPTSVAHPHGSGPPKPISGRRRRRAPRGSRNGRFRPRPAADGWAGSSPLSAGPRWRRGRRPVECRSPGSGCARRSDASRRRVFPAGGFPRGSWAWREYGAGNETMLPRACRAHPHPTEPGGCCGGRSTGQAGTSSRMRKIETARIRSRSG